MAVPPGLVTWSFSRPGCSPVSSTSLAAPSTVWAARAIATGRDRPTFTPPSASASMAMKTKAGPEPERPVTASRSGSSTMCAEPTAWKRARAWARSSSVAWAPRARALAPSPTSTAVFGMVRTIRTPVPSLRAIFAIEMPAAIEITSLRWSMAGAISSSSASMTCGFTDSTTTSACSVASRLSERTCTP